jgi:hypothetical protein
MRNLKKLCHNQRFSNSSDCLYLEYEKGKENPSDWDAPTRYKFKWVKDERV